LDHYEAKLKEIINTCTSIDRNHWRAQGTISSRRKRTELSQSDIFKKRKGKFTEKNEIFRYKGQSFKHRVLNWLSQNFFQFLGYRFEGVEFQERMLYSMGSNKELFGITMSCYGEK
jgi:hypothetical protein